MVMLVNAGVRERITFGKRDVVKVVIARCGSGFTGTS